MILLLDNYDSFVHNVAHALRVLGAGVEVVRSDRLTVAEAVDRDPSHIVISPGPGRPVDAGISVPLVKAMGGRVPILGICLGHQVIAAAYGAMVVRARAPRHGAASEIEHLGVGILEGLPSPFVAGRYHSLALTTARLPDALEPVAWTDDGEIMAVRHRTHGVWGVQFHPESILTPSGPAIFSKFLALRGTDVGANQVGSPGGSGKKSAPHFIGRAGPGESRPTGSTGRRA